MEIRQGGLDAPEVAALLEHHTRLARAQTPPCSAHALDLEELRAPEISFFSGWVAAGAVQPANGTATELAAVGALKRLSEVEGELKSMHTAEAFRGQGLGGRMLERLLREARSMGLARVSLETGVQPYFDPAVRLYRRHGFVGCAPFASYRPDPNSLFLSLALSG